MKKIKLSQGQYALIDNEDFERVNQFKWYAIWQEGLNGFYAVRTDYTFGKHQTIYMHREIMNTPDGLQCDHINRETLDNRRVNLRNCTVAQNTMNRSLNSNNTSGYMGVTKFRRKWQARIRKGGKAVYARYFDTALEAAIARDQAAIQHYGEFANLNFQVEKEKK